MIRNNPAHDTITPPGQIVTKTLGDYVEQVLKEEGKLSPPPLRKRYLVIEKSLSAHCCFVATVIDMNRPMLIGGLHYRDVDGELQYETVCECFTMEDAVLVGQSLNSQK